MMIKYFTPLLLLWCSMLVASSADAQSLNSLSAHSPLSELITLQQAAPSLSTEALHAGWNAYKQAQHNGLVHNDILTIIDYDQPSSAKRLWIFDMKEKTLLFHTYVSHGRGSGTLFAEDFSNQPQSYATSVGVYLTAETYRGKHGYSMRLDGLENGFNDNARKRYIVLHGADYAQPHVIKQTGRLGLSLGCPALDPRYAMPIINTIKSGSILVMYGTDPRWLRHSRYI